MGKNTFFTEQPVFNQPLQLLPKHIINDVAKYHQSDRYYKRFRTYEHLVTMLYLIGASVFHLCLNYWQVFRLTDIPTHSSIILQ